MAAVVDASALAKLFLEEEGHAEMRAWFKARLEAGEEILAPHLAGYELGRVIQRTHDDLGPDEQAQLLSIVADQLTLRWPSDAAAFQACRDDGLTFYDAAYLALAGRGDHTLVTADRAMAEAAEARGLLLRRF